MAAGISKATTVPLLALTFIFSAIGLGLSAALIAKSTFSGYEPRAVIIQGCFACAWTVLFSLIFMITSVAAPRNSFFSAGVVGIFIFLGFLQLIVAAGSSVALYKSEGAGYNASVHKAWLAFAFVSAFFALFTTVAAFLNYVAGKAVDVEPRKEEDPHF
ncbi:uncharacterized protein JCM15063_004894 [Sporobolomyces koalae]|uniref:uncharacterized protein n=1 Tax=Sporobolomyces koalae TaxID=500713 RepID=UPI00316DA96F